MEQIFAPVSKGVSMRRLSQKREAPYWWNIAELKVVILRRLTLNTGVDDYVVCSGVDACHGYSLYASVTIVSGKCLLCSTGSCDQPCAYIPPGRGGDDRIDGAKNGDCDGLTVPIVLAGQSIAA